MVRDGSRGPHLRKEGIAASSDGLLCCTGGSRPSRWKNYPSHIIQKLYGEKAAMLFEVSKYKYSRRCVLINV